ncbi:protease modulator HflC [Kistimonas asteriae]|uniref:protease modulator HflC n=1 Tax=Kistimonas asteriae TaxID=517724 RepID=UPI001BA86C42|nr:protease modulator HflC [Kistimonas asteriae]
MNSKAMTALILIGVVLLGVISSVYVVSERERAVLLRFGEIVKPDVKPGLHFKIPFIDKLRVFDGRIQTLDVPQERFFTQEKKAVIVDAYIKWRIANVQEFYRSTSGDAFRANTLLSQRAGSRLREKFGVLTLNEVVSGQRDELMTEITETLNRSVERLGMQVLDVRVKKIDLPPQVSDSVFDRMSSERRKEAQEYRSKGSEMAKAIRANADRERQVIIAAAYRDSQKTRGEGDAKAAAIYSKAYGEDTEFYSFYRSLRAYRETFDSSSDILLLEPDSEFFQFMNSASGKQ